jgi:hypothetical protein
LTIGAVAGPPCATGPCPYDYAFANGVYDGEPDLFLFNFAGYSGKFYFNDDRTPVLLPDQNIKIEYYFPNDTASVYIAKNANIQGFILTTPDGIKYYLVLMPVEHHQVQILSKLFFHILTIIQTLQMQLMQAGI